MISLSGHDIIQATKNPNEVTMCCMFCNDRKGSPDTKFHLGINIRYGIYNCYRCSASGKVKNLDELYLLANINHDVSFDTIRSRVNGLFSVMPDPEEYDIDKISWSIDSTNTPFAYKYMIERGYTDDELSRYDVRVGRAYYDEKLQYDVKRWAGRVLFPYYFNGSCIYIVGRAYAEKDPKYLNTTHGKALVVYGLSEVSGIAILCEGIISAHAAQRSTGVPAVSVLGKRPTMWQLSMLKTKCSKVYLSLDGDVLRGSPDTDHYKVAKALSTMGFEVWDIELPDGEDPDSLKESYLDYFNKAKKISLF